MSEVAQEPEAQPAETPDEEQLTGAEPTEGAEPAEGAEPTESAEPTD